MPGLSGFFFQGERDQLAPEEAKQRAASIA